MSDRNESWARVTELFHAALDRPAPERAAFLTEACGEDHHLRREVESLLFEASASASFLEPQPGVAAARVLSVLAQSLTGQLVNGMEVGPLLGAGGMGDVYKAHDSRLGRDVAIKVLPPAFSGDAQRLRRFEQEARAVARVNHPNVIVIHDVGSHNGAPYVVTELLDGQDLRHRLAAGPLSQARAIELAIEIALGLAAAHERGIVHRDVKPENLFIKSDGHLKILDFGLAKLATSIAAHDERTRTNPLPSATEAGMVLGTAGYMSPEQVRGEEVDHRCDIFSFGVVLYEMLSGRRAFAGDSVIETMSAVLNDEPPSIVSFDSNLSPMVDRIVGLCLRKRPDDRFQSARDLALALDAISLGTASGAPPGVRSTSTPGFRKLTFRRGTILNARFTPDGQNVVYSAAWDGQPCELYTARIDGRESRSLGIHRADVLSVSHVGELAVLLKDNYLLSADGVGILARVPIGGGTPRELAEHVFRADWSPTGELAVTVDVSGKGNWRIEYPLGQVLHESPYLGSLRISPDGQAVAALEQKRTGHDSLIVLGKGRGARMLVQGVGPLRAIAWTPDGSEVLFTRKPSTYETALCAVTLDGRIRELYRADGIVALCDVSQDGRVLLYREINRLELRCFGEGSDIEQDRSWLDGSAAAGMSEDGRTVAFGERRGGGGIRGGVYLARSDGSAPVRLGDGYALDLSPDGKWVMALDMNDPPGISLIPTRAGRQHAVPLGDLYPWGGSFITNDRVGFHTGGPDGKTRVYVARIDGSELRLVTDDPIVNGSAPSPDGRFIALVRSDRRTSLYPVDGGEPQFVQGVQPGEVPLQWSQDGQCLYVRRLGELPAYVYRVNIATGERTLWKTLMPSDPTGVAGIANVVMTRNGLYYAYTCARIVSSELYVVEGIL